MGFIIILEVKNLQGRRGLGGDTKIGSLPSNTSKVAIVSLATRREAVTNHTD
jgi:hypothetical protein